MKSSRPKRKRRTAALAAEMLETRQMLTGGVGSTFAIVPGTITKTGGQVSVSFNLNPAYFTDPGNKPFQLGIDIAPGTNSTVNPVIESVTTPTGKTLGVTHAVYDTAVKRTGVEATNKNSTAVMVTIPGLPAKTSKSFTYKVNVGAVQQTSGQVLVGFYLPGDANGVGTVNQSDINAIKFAMGSNAAQTSGNYSFDADANRDGQVNAKDLAIAKKDLGVGTTVSPVISANVAPTEMTDPTNRITNQNTVTITGALTPNATITYQETGEVPVTATADKTGNYSITIPLLTGSNTYNVTTVDAFGQTITGAINSITYDPNAVPVASTATPPTTTTTTPPTTPTS
jgi:Dockerin type I domain/Bacterial Ig domain